MVHWSHVVYCSNALSNGTRSSHAPSRYYKKNLDYTYSENKHYYDYFCNFIKKFVWSCGCFGSCKTKLSVVWLNQDNIFIERWVMWLMGVNISINWASVWFFPPGCYIPQSRVLTVFEIMNFRGWFCVLLHTFYYTLSFQDGIEVENSIWKKTTDR